MGHHTCCVVNCKNNGVRNKECKFYKFPAAQYKVEQRKKWIAAVKRKNPDGSPWCPKRWDLICSAHFIGNKKSEEESSPSYIPTIFPPAYKTKVVDQTGATKRHERFMKRRINKQEPITTTKAPERVVEEVMEQPEPENKAYGDSSSKWCAYYHCDSTKRTHPDLRRFPFPIKDTVRFRKWAENSGNLDFSNLPVNDIKSKQLCELHFDQKYLVNKKLSNIAVPKHYITNDDSPADESSEGVFKCDYYNCGNSIRTHPGLRLFKFPIEDEEICRKWIENSGMEFVGLSLEELRLKRLCHLHFDDKFLVKFQLIDKGVPRHYSEIYDKEIVCKIEVEDSPALIKTEFDAFEETYIKQEETDTFNIQIKQEIEKDYRIFLPDIEQNLVNVKEEIEEGPGS